LKEILSQKILPQPGFEPGTSLSFRGERPIQSSRHVIFIAITNVKKEKEHFEKPTCNKQ